MSKSLFRTGKWRGFNVGLIAVLAALGFKPLFCVECAPNPLLEGEILLERTGA